MTWRCGTSTLHPQAEPELKAPPKDMQALLDSGGDFADGVIAFEGELLRGPGVRVIRPAGRELAQGAQGPGECGGSKPFAH